MATEYQTVGVEEVRRETPRAFLLSIDGGELWVPKAVIAEPDALGVGDEDVDVEIESWFCHKENIG